MNEHPFLLLFFIKRSIVPRDSHVLKLVIAWPVRNTRVYERKRPCISLVSMLEGNHSKRPKRTGKMANKKERKQKKLPLVH